MIVLAACIKQTGLHHTYEDGLYFQAVMVCCRADKFGLAQEVCKRLWPKKDRKDRVKVRARLFEINDVIS